MTKNIFYAQSGGVTAVINASACGVIETAGSYKQFGKVFAGRNGIIGALREELIDTSKETRATISALKHTPSGAFGSCRYKLKSIDENRKEYERLTILVTSSTTVAVIRRIQRTRFLSSVTPWDIQ